MFLLLLIYFYLKKVNRKPKLIVLLVDSKQDSFCSVTQFLWCVPRQLVTMDNGWNSILLQLSDAPVGKMKPSLDIL